MEGSCYHQVAGTSILSTMKDRVTLTHICLKIICTNTMQASHKLMDGPEPWTQRYHKREQDRSGGQVSNPTETTPWTNWG